MPQRPPPPLRATQRQRLQLPQHMQPLPPLQPKLTLGPQEPLKHLQTPLLPQHWQTLPTS
jgi:hypothetical protein